MYNSRYDSVACFWGARPHPRPLAFAPRSLSVLSWGGFDVNRQLGEVGVQPGCGGRKASVRGSVPSKWVIPSADVLPEDSQGLSADSLHLQEPGGSRAQGPPVRPAPGKAAATAIVCASNHVSCLVPQTETGWWLEKEGEVK